MWEKNGQKAISMLQPPLSLISRLHSVLENREILKWLLKVQFMIPADEIVFMPDT
jgi:hypothetical protein